ncbi:hypothetical protein BRADI_1g59140v3 [Brachypodium distachyon]|uniref:Uncharacterized protein n=1 Tax=Brachypodium distachyon TaxID=15368 RepID=I1H4B6_BRADI|nr:hypothetical protein BRADI_1g59140v3 [Brachypodium distachyon]
MGRKKNSAKGRRAHSRRSPLRVSSRAGPGKAEPKPGSSRASSGGRRARGELPCAPPPVIPFPPPVSGAPEQQPALSTGSGGGGLPHWIRSSYSPGSDSDEFDLLVAGAGTNEDEKEQHIADYLAGFLSDGEYSVPMDGGKEEDGLRDYAGKAVFIVRDHVAEGYKEYPTDAVAATTYNDMMIKCSSRMDLSWMSPQRRRRWRRRVPCSNSRMMLTKQLSTTPLTERRNAMATARRKLSTAARMMGTIARTATAWRQHSTAARMMGTMVRTMAVAVTGTIRGMTVTGTPMMMIAMIRSTSFACRRRRISNRFGSVRSEYSMN